MSRRRKRGGMAALGNSMHSRDRRHKQSAMMRASGFGRRKKGRDTGLTGWFSRGLGGKKKNGLASQVGSSLRERLSPTERAQIADEAAAEAEHMNEKGSDNNLLTRFLQGIAARIRRE